MLFPPLAAPSPPPQLAGCLCTSEETTCMSGDVNVARACGCQDSGNGNPWCFVVNPSTCVEAEQARSTWVAPCATPPQDRTQAHCIGRCRTHTFGPSPPPASSTACATCRRRGPRPSHRPLPRPRYHQESRLHRHRRLRRQCHRQPRRRRRLPPAPPPPRRPHRAHGWHFRSEACCSTVCRT